MANQARTALFNRSQAEGVVPMQNESILTPTAEDDLRFAYELIADEGARAQLRALALSIKRFERRTRDELFSFGRRLNEIKPQIPHGRFVEWMEAEFTVSLNTLRNMMRVAEVFDEEQKRNVAFLSDSALYLLAGPKVSEEARQLAIAEAQQQQRSPRRARLIEIIRDHRDLTLSDGEYSVLPAPALAVEMAQGVRAVIAEASLWEALRTALHTRNWKAMSSDQIDALLVAISEGLLDEVEAP